jgi:hypothetical protein
MLGGQNFGRISNISDDYLQNSWYLSRQINGLGWSDPDVQATFRIRRYRHPSQAVRPEKACRPKRCQGLGDALGNKYR